MKKKIISTLYFILLFAHFFAQEPVDLGNNSFSQLYNNSVSYYSTDDQIVNGCQYTFPSKIINGNPFYKNKIWNNAQIYINNNEFTKFQLTYDLVRDVLVIKVKFNNDVERFIELNKLSVDSFILDSSLFVNSSLLLNDLKESVFYEQISLGKISMYKLYDKRFINLYDEMSPNGKFSELKTNLYLFEDRSLYNVNTNYLFIHYFDKEYRKDIKKYFNNNNIKLKAASHSQLKGLLDYCNSLITR